MKYPDCPHRIPPNPDPESKFLYCKIASELSNQYAIPTAAQCQACTTHPTSPQKVNGIVCAVAKKAQLNAGLEVDEKLIRCIHTEQLLDAKTLLFLRDKWDALHSYRLDPWDPVKAFSAFLAWKEDIPVFGCTSCASHFDKILETNPILFDDQETYFYTTWEAHNLVNKRIYKEQFPLNKAKEKYGYL